MPSLPVPVAKMIIRMWFPIAYKECIKDVLVSKGWSTSGTVEFMIPMSKGVAVRARLLPIHNGRANIPKGEEGETLSVYAGTLIYHQKVCTKTGQGPNWDEEDEEVPDCDEEDEATTDY